MEAVYIIACVILIKQVLWNFVQSPNSSLVRIYLTIWLFTQHLNILMIFVWNIFFKSVRSLLHYVNACRTTQCKYSIFFYFYLKIFVRSMIPLVEQSKKTFIQGANLPTLYVFFIVPRIFHFVSKVIVVFIS